MQCIQGLLPYGECGRYFPQTGRVSAEDWERPGDEHSGTKNTGSAQPIPYSCL